MAPTSAMTATVTTALGTARNTLFALALGAWRILIAVKHRRVLSELASLDDRRLADIGLTRSDLRDARSQPLWHDPTRMLAGRAATRRVSRRRTAFELSAAKIAGGDCHPSADRPAGYLT